MLQWIIIIAIIIYSMFLVKILFGVLVEKGSPSRTLAWVFFILMVPLFGIFVYFIFGKNQRKEKLFHRKRSQEIATLNPLIEKHFIDLDKESNSQNEAVDKNKKLINLLARNENALLTNGNHVEILNNGEATFSSIYQAIRQAQSFIHLEYYIFKEGEIARQLLSLLKEKVAKGVIVRIIYDAVGSWKLSPSFIQEFKTVGIDIRPFMPVRFGLVANKVNYRNHRKIIVIDGIIAFTGGINIDDAYLYGDKTLGKWRDTHLRLEGPAAQSLNTIFIKDWFFMSGQNLSLLPPSRSGGSTSPGVPVQIIGSGPGNDYASIRQEYFMMINSADSYIYMSTPYFIPGEAILLALTTAALSGIEIILLVPNKTDSNVLKWSMQSYFEELLEAGVKIWAYQKGFLHNKVVLSDDQVCSIGTANIDERSFESNFEVNALIYDRDFCLELKDDFMEDLQHSKEILLTQFKRRPRTDKLKESSARLLSPLL